MGASVVVVTECMSSSERAQTCAGLLAHTVSLGRDGFLYHGQVLSVRLLARRLASGRSARSMYELEVR